ncbi:hypothetical protein L249_1767 [Ophiocordyceps polyrhachis-furcata BCC 54312]|uniref:Uncharacterized protein n=1 Tax=Ophiocordyceps polyrhachis-furcata BCC 54312 TaxID=1330021 RepID=A0A367LN85_9HYPO|nr:hypothetical protein L249_1767 [Ophiocordyceps polyrhachis-furcata BCC 54312]
MLPYCRKGLVNPGPQHLSAAIQVLEYLNHTDDLSILFSGHDNSIIAMSDSSFGDNHDRKSTHGFVIRVFGGVVAFKSGKEDTVTTSSTEAEFLALSRVVKEDSSQAMMSRSNVIISRPSGIMQ